MLPVVFERAAKVCMTDFSASGLVLPQITLLGASSGIAEDVLAPFDGTGVTGVVNAEAWGARLLISADRDCMSAVVDTLLGADGTAEAQAFDRPPTRIERMVTRVFFARFIQSFATVFAPIARTPFLVEGAETKVNFDVLGRKRAPVVLGRFEVSVLGRTGLLVMAIPEAALDPLREVLSVVPGEDDKPADPVWAEQLGREVTKATVELTAVLQEIELSLGDLAGLRVGQVLELSATPRTPVPVEAQGERLMLCQLGKSNGYYTLKVEDFVDREQEFYSTLKPD